MTGFLLLLAATQDAEPMGAEDRHFRWAHELFTEGSQDSLYSAYYSFEAFVDTYPGSTMAVEAKRYMMESAKQLCIVGYPEQIWRIAIPFTESSYMGEQLLRNALARFPTERFSSDYQLWLAEHFYTEEDWEESEAEFRVLLESYSASPHAPRALFRLGEVALLRFRGIEYDSEPLSESRHRFEQFVEQYPRHELATEARARLDTIRELLAQHWLNTGDYYRSRGQETSAAFMYRAVRRQFGESASAEAAATRLRELGEEP